MQVREMSAPLPAYLEIVDFIASGTTPETLIAWKPSAESDDRLAKLIQCEREGSLSPDEQSELDHYLELEHILRMAKARARQILSSRG